MDSSPLLKQFKLPEDKEPKINNTIGASVLKTPIDTEDMNKSSEMRFITVEDENGTPQMSMIDMI